MRQFSTIILSFVFLFFSVALIAQNKKEKGTKARVAVVEATETIPVEDWMTRKQAKMLAIRKAMETAMGNEFGWLVSSERISYRESTFKNGQARDTYDSDEVIVNRVKGYWLKTIEEESNFHWDEEREELWVRTYIKGKAKEIVEAPISFIAEPLKCKDPDACQTEDFVNDDNFFMRFVTPVEGYLAVFLALEEEVQCLLPYEGMKGSFMEVNADEEYILFSEPQSPEYYMYTEEPTEIDMLTVIFSKTPFDKPILQDANEEIADDGSTLPKELSKDDFYKWLTKLRSIKEDTQVKEIMLSIKQRS